MNQARAARALDVCCTLFSEKPRVPTEVALQVWVATDWWKTAQGQQHGARLRPAAASTQTLGAAFWTGLANEFSVATSDRQWRNVRDMVN